MHSEHFDINLTLPDPIYAVDGTIIYSQLIMHRFEIKDFNKIFVFQLHPSDINSCPQYLVIAR